MPVVRDASWPRTTIDRFILAKLEEKGWRPSSPASRRDWARRVYFDVIGLPPSPEEVAAFENDRSPAAFERLVDRLLDRPEYGERWARHWLDAVHFAETHGHDQDRPRPNAWPYRDYVIRAFNEDKPYARFIQEQLAADAFFPEEPAKVVALGFLATGPWDESSLRDIREDSIDRQIARYIDRDDIVATVMNTFASTTVQCARCHDHKFDPVSLEEYYNLQAVFAGTDKANRRYDPDPQVQRRRRELLARQQALASPTAEVQRELLGPDSARQTAHWEAQLPAPPALWETLHPISALAAKGAALQVHPDGAVRSAGTRAETDQYTVVAEVPSAKALRIEVLADSGLPKDGPGRADNGNFHLTDFRVFALGPDGSEQALALRHPSADFNQPDWGIEKAIDRDPKTGWGIHPQTGQRHVAVFELASPLERPERLKIVLHQEHGGGHLIGRFRLSASTTPPPVRASLVPDAIARVLLKPAAERLDADRLVLAQHRAAEEAAAQLAALPELAVVYAGTRDFLPDGSFKPAAAPRPVHVLRRGDIHQPGAAAAPGALSCVPGVRADFNIPPEAPEEKRRAELARWLTDPNNTLTWRSIVNRVWHHHFGRGLVNTPNDFGRMGSQPSHPELLDWLAGWFLDHGGSLKKLHKLILTSSVYRQDSRDVPEFSREDADNIWLWRMNRTRLDAESVRDAILAAAEELDGTMGGPSVQQFLMSPGIHVTPKVDYLGYDIDSPGARRRSVYRFIFRTLPDPFMDSLDCPDSSQLTPARNTSVTVTQALAMLNDQFVAHYSERLADRLRRERMGNLSAQVEHAWTLVLGRAAAPEESARAVKFAAEHGLPNLCRVLFNSNEFMFIN